MLGLLFVCRSNSPHSIIHLGVLILLCHLAFFEDFVATHRFVESCIFRTYEQRVYPILIKIYSDNNRRRITALAGKF